MRHAWTALALLLGLPLTLIACIWDRDTPADEAKGLPEVVAVLTGRFPRNPPRFYEMRLARVSDHLRAHPADLAAYDDAGVACDRLGRGDEATAWMEKKRTQLDALDASRPEVKEQRYRYHANLGTFLVHRWARQGADRAKIAEVKAARDEIARALEINPQAHFGREAYQLRALDRIIHPPEVKDPQYELPNLLGWAPLHGGESDGSREAEDAIRGLSGLVVLGNAWESVDVFHTLGVALQRDGRSTLAYLAWLRGRELIDAGRSSLLPGAPTGEDLKQWLFRPQFVEAAPLLDSTFPRLRAEADAWQAARTAFMMRRMEQGRHPDTDPNFWDGYVDRPAPSLPTQTLPGRRGALLAWQRRMPQWVNITLISAPILALVAGIWALRAAMVRRRNPRFKAAAPAAV